MADIALLSSMGAQPSKPSKWKPLTTKRWFTGLFTQRNPFNAPGSRYDERFLGRTDALIDGQNVEITNAGTLKRRPGFTLSATFASVPKAFYTFQRLDTTTKVIVDTATGVYDLATPATPFFTKSTSAQTFFQGVGNQLFFGDGTDLKKWDGTTVTNWGIVAPSTAPTLSFPAGSLSITSGYQYGYTFKNSTTLHISTMSPVSANTGKRTGVSVTLTGDRSTDPQVDKVQIYRTTDGPGADYELLAEINNPVSGSWTFTDTSPDSALNADILGPQALANNPPPAGLVNVVFHSDRLWGSVGNIVYYSGGPDTTNGSGNESWPPLNNFVFPSKVTRLVPYANALLVFTTNCVWAIYGTDSDSYYDKRYQDGLGLLSYNALDVEGSEIFMLTADRQFVQISPSQGMSEVGFGIGDLLETIDPASACVACHISGHRDKAVYLSDGSTNIWRLNPNQAPEGGPCWSPKATITGGVGVIASVETSAGVHKLFIGQSTGKVLARDLTVFTDNGTAYSAFATIGSLVLAQPGELAEIAAITTELVATGTQPTVGVLLDEISGTFETLTSSVSDPPGLTASTSLLSNRFYLLQGNAVVARHMQVKLTFATEAAGNELLAMTVFGALHPE
jgi:hypothetical protein